MSFNRYQNFSEVVAANAATANQAAVAAAQNANSAVNIANTAASVASTNPTPAATQTAAAAAQNASDAVNAAAAAAAAANSANAVAAGAATIPATASSSTVPGPTFVVNPSSGISMSGIILFILCILLIAAGVFLFINRHKIKFESSPSMTPSFSSR